MYRQIALVKALKKEYSRQQELASRLEKKLQLLPKGSLSNKKGIYYRIISENGKSLQLPIPHTWSGSELLIDELKEFQYIKKILPLLRNNLHCFEQLLKGLEIYDYVDLQKHMAPVYQDFVSALFLPEGDLIPEIWAKTPYHTNPVHPENLIHESEGGLLTRSKAESMIATKLEDNNFIFRYEPELILGEKTIYPDFCALRIHDRKLMYWEHFGKMDDPQYAHKTMDKLNLYGKHGYRLGDNFIMTWETKAMPLTFHHINSCISNFLLPNNEV